MLSWGVDTVPHRRTLAPALALVLLAPFAARTAPAQQRREQHLAITADLSQGASFKFKIAPDLPEFSFKVIPEVQNPDASGNPQSTIQDVQVFRGASKEPLQTLEGCEWLGMEPPYRNADWFRVEDINFDGYADIFVPLGELRGTKLAVSGSTMRRQENSSSAKSLRRSPRLKCIRIQRP